MFYFVLIFAFVFGEEIEVNLSNGRRLMISGDVVTGTSVAPYVVAILACSIYGNQYYCGKFCSGSLIAPDVVLTAGHCTRDSSSPYGVDNPPIDLSRMYILAGTVDLYNGTGTLVKVSSLVNGGFGLNVRYELDNDIGLLFLNSCVTIRSGIVETIKVATLDSEPNWATASCANRTVKTFGFGLKSNLPSTIASDDGKLKKITSIAHGPDTCTQAYVDASMASIGQTSAILDLPQYSAYRAYYYTTVVGDYHICAGGQTSTSSCFGDSGGPVVAFADDSSNRQIVGVTSFGVSQFCGLGPDFTQRTATHSQWIVDQIGLHGKTCVAASQSFATWPVTTLTFQQHTSRFRSSRCADSAQWQCQWGRCLNASFVCNTSYDCGTGDYSDEDVDFCSASRRLDETQDELQNLIYAYKAKHPEVANRKTGGDTPHLIVVGSLSDRRVSDGLPAGMPPLPVSLQQAPHVKATKSTNCGSINTLINGLITAAQTAGDNAAETNYNTFQTACLTEKSCVFQVGFTVDSSVDDFCSEMLTFISNTAIATQLETGFNTKYSETCLAPGQTTTTTTTTTRPTTTTTRRTTTRPTTTTTRRTTTRPTTTTTRRTTTTKKKTTTKKTTTTRKSR